MSRPAAIARRAAAAVREFVLEPLDGPEAERPVEAGSPAPPPRGERATVILVTAIGRGGGAASVAAAIGVAAGEGERSRGVLLVDLQPPTGGRGPTLLASEGARELEESVRALGGPYRAAAARGHLCYLPLADEQDPLELVGRLVATPLPAAVVIAHLPQSLWPRAVADPSLGASSGVICAELSADRALAALAVRELHARGLRAKVVSRPLGMVASRRALAGIDPAGGASRRAQGLARALLR